MKVGFYCISGARVGYGHLSRMLELARGFLAAGENSVIYVDGPWPDFLAGENLRCDTVDAMIADSDIVIFDGPEYERFAAVARNLDAKVLTVQVDDIGSSQLFGDVILNPNLYGNDLHYSDDRGVLAGPRYNLLAPELFALRQQSTGRDAILISFGGSDSGQYGIPVAKAVSFGDRPVMLAFACRRKDLPQGELQALEAKGISIYCGANLAQLLARSRLYIGAAGVTSVEALAAGCRIAVCAIAANQQLNITKLRSAGYPALDHFDAGQLAALSIEAWREPQRAQPLIENSGIDEVIAQLRSLLVECRQGCLGYGGLGHGCLGHGCLEQ